MKFIPLPSAAPLCYPSLCVDYTLYDISDRLEDDQFHQRQSTVGKCPPQQLLVPTQPPTAMQQKAEIIIKETRIANIQSSRRRR